MDVSATSHMEISAADLVQTGALGVFAWYALQNNREWRQYLADRNGKIEKALEKITIVLDKFK
jgi:predicted component of type VI protein secretion system